MDDLQTLCIWDHGVVLTGDVEILKHTHMHITHTALQQTSATHTLFCDRRTHTLIELSVAAACHGGVVTAIDLGDVVALDVGDLVHGQVACKRHLEEGV